MKRLYSFLLCLCILLSFTSKANDSLYVSLLTAAPGSQPYELFGHTGIRIRDIVFHYGLFDFNAPHFFYRFTKGETDYSIGAESYRDFIYSYVSRGSTVYEQEMLLSKAEADRLCDTLLTNMKPANRIYRYNFLFDNCATRPRDKIEHCLSGTLDYGISDTAMVTFRELIHLQTANNPWLTFGIDLALGAPLDQPISYRQQMFLPYILQEAIGKAIIREEGDTIRPLVGETYAYEGIPCMAEENRATPFTPTLVCTLLVLLVLLFSIGEYRYGRHIRLPDYLIFGLYGVTGCLLFFLIFISIHPATSPNYSILWCHPFLWVVVLCEAFAPKRGFTTQLMSLLLLVSIGVFIAMWFLPQVFNPAFYPLALIPAVRSVTWIKIELKNGRL